MPVAALTTFRKPGNWLTGKASCLECKSEWQQVIEADEYEKDGFWLHCPCCETYKGRFIYPFYFGKTAWTCECGNDLMRITRKFIYCPNCGKEQIL